MMNKLTRKVAIALAVGTMTIAATGAIAHASEIQKIETVDVSIDDCTSYWICAPTRRVADSNWFDDIVDWVGATWDWIG